MKKLLIIFVLLFVVSCTPNLSNQLTLYNLDPTPTQAQRDFFKDKTAPKIRIGVVNDLRTQKIVGEIDGRSLTEKGDATKVIQNGLEKYFSNNGYDISLFNAPTILSELSSWVVTIKPRALSTLVTSNAEIILSLLNRNGKVIYRSVYNGSYTGTGIFFSQSDVEKILLEAMHIALLEASNDEKLREAISNNQ